MNRQRETILLVTLVIALAGLDLDGNAKDPSKLSPPAAVERLARTNGAAAEKQPPSAPPKTIELPPAERQIPLPNGWTRKQFIDRFIWLFSATPAGIFANRWLGIPTIQNPFDAWVTQEIMYEVKPDFVVEAGTFKGGSAVLWATILGEINANARVITIDIEDQRTARAKNMLIARRKVDFMLGSSTDPAIVAEITRRVKRKRVLVILDSLHTKEHVLNELRAYAPLVNVGSYVIVQDGLINGHPIPTETGPGPWEAVEEFMIDNDEFVIDHTRERLLVTCNPNGFLKRVRPTRDP